MSRLCYLQAEHGCQVQQATRSLFVNMQLPAAIVCSMKIILQMHSALMSAIKNKDKANKSRQVHTNYSSSEWLLSAQLCHCHMTCHESPEAWANILQVVCQSIVVFKELPSDFASRTHVLISSPPSYFKPIF